MTTIRKESDPRYEPTYTPLQILEWLREQLVRAKMQYEQSHGFKSSLGLGHLQDIVNAIAEVDRQSQEIKKLNEKAVPSDHQRAAIYSAEKTRQTEEALNVAVGKVIGLFVRPNINLNEVNKHQAALMAGLIVKELALYEKSLPRGTRRKVEEAASKFNPATILMDDLRKRYTVLDESLNMSPARASATTAFSSDVRGYEAAKQHLKKEKKQVMLHSTTIQETVGEIRMTIAKPYVAGRSLLTKGNRVPLSANEYNSSYAQKDDSRRVTNLVYDYVPKEYVLTRNKETSELHWLERFDEKGKPMINLDKEELMTFSAKSNQELLARDDVKIATFNLLQQELRATYGQETGKKDFIDHVAFEKPTTKAAFEAHCKRPSEKVYAKARAEVGDDHSRDDHHAHHTHRR